MNANDPVGLIEKTLVRFQTTNGMRMTPKQVATAIWGALNGESAGSAPPDAPASPFPAGPIDVALDNQAYPTRL